MSKSKPYKVQESKPQLVCESVVAYHSSLRNAEEFIQAIPDATMHNMVHAAIKDYESGRCITTEELDALVKKRMGW